MIMFTHSPTLCEFRLSLPEKQAYIYRYSYLVGMYGIISLNVQGRVQKRFWMPVAQAYWDLEKKGS